MLKQGPVSDPECTDPTVSSSTSSPCGCSLLIWPSALFHQGFLCIGQAPRNEALHKRKRYSIIALVINLNGPISLGRISPELNLYLFQWGAPFGLMSWVAPLHVA
jgi:hypothetical protein